ncbi:hypothetical protein F4561_002615 [Lipingzhangella halophila]|uniref:Uncharacterized protein n=1 Tax=Lipingzhangella halophila TaxID=1783352 RepID=A0A7W7RGZ3_9ACTN|nr:hypothetical protein [Lipingzhangella halophila]MBB4931795.1 hypothetical protein [Lipingzhangella halophila]
MIARLWSLLRPAAPSQGAAPDPAPMSEESAVAHIETVHRMVSRTRLDTRRWVGGKKRLSTHDALELADSAKEAIEYLRSYATHIVAEVALDEELAAADPDELGGA